MKFNNGLCIGINFCRLFCFRCMRKQLMGIDEMKGVQIRDLPFHRIGADEISFFFLYYIIAKE